MRRAAILLPGHLAWPWEGGAVPPASERRDVEAGDGCVTCANSAGRGRARAAWLPRPHAPLLCRPACVQGSAPDAGEPGAGGRDACHATAAPTTGVSGRGDQAARGCRRSHPETAALASPEGREPRRLLGLSLSRPLQPDGADPTTPRVDTVPSEHLPAGSHARHRESRVGRAEPVRRPRGPARTPGCDDPRQERNGSDDGRFEGYVEISTTRKKRGSFFH